jgi:hypothetical protein
MEKTTRHESNANDIAKRKQREAKFGNVAKPANTDDLDAKQKRAQKFNTRPQTEESLNRQNTFKKNISSHLTISV